MAKKRVRPPRWADRLIKAIGRTVKPIDPMGELGFRLDEDVETRKWLFYVYPSLNEIYGGPRDGKVIAPGFALCLTALMQVFDAPPHVDWITPTGFSGDLDGPHICVDGVYRGVPLMVLFFDQPPIGDKPYLVLNSLTGEVKPREASDAESA